MTDCHCPDERSHATYYFTTAGKTAVLVLTHIVTVPELKSGIGCHFSLKDYAKAQELLDTIPSLLDKRKFNGKELPTEIFIQKKCTTT
jgi:hypothetical protein